MSKKDPEEPEELKVIFKFHAKNPNGISADETKKWMRQAKLIGDKTELQDTGVDKTFQEVAKDKSELDLAGFRDFIVSLSTANNMQKKDVMDKLVAAGKPKN